MVVMRRFACVMILLGSSACLSGIVRAQQLSSSPSTVVAKQGNTSVTLAEVDAFAQGIPEKERAGFFDSPQRLESLISTLLLKKQLAAEARAAGIDQDPAVKQRVELTTNDELAKARMQRFTDEVKVPDLSDLATEDYQAHKEKYKVVGKVDVKHVLVSTKTRKEDEAKALADTVEKEAKAKPMQFDQLIEKYSEDPSKATNKGLIIDAGSENYTRAFADASKALKKPGDISPPIKTNYGFHIIQLVQRTPDHQQTFAEVREQILQRLRSEYIEKQVANHTDQLRNQTMDANPDLVASLRTRYAASANAVDASPAPTQTPAH